MNFFLLGRAPAAPCRHPLFRSSRADRLAQAAILLLGLIFLAGGLNSAAQRYYTETGGVPQPPLHGIWNVEDFSWDGQPHPPLLTDDARWRRVVFENVHPFARRCPIFQHGRFAGAEEMILYGMNDEPEDDAIAVVNSAGTIELYEDLEKKPDVLTFALPSPHQLILDGTVAGHRIHARLKLFDSSNFYLVTHSNRVHWVGSGAYR